METICLKVLKGVQNQVSKMEEGMATHSSILAWKILIDRGA